MSSTPDIYAIIATVALVLFALLSTIISLLFVYQSRQTKSKIELGRVRSTYESEILRTRLEIKEQTLQNISQDIHDNVGQLLSLAKLNLSSLDLSDADPKKEKIEKIMGLISKSIADLRNLSRTLDADIINKEGLLPSLQLELTMLEDTGVYKTLMHIEGVAPTLENADQLLIFRIVQEAINNIIKHAKATEIKLSVIVASQLIIAIQDNGKGFDANRQVRGAGLSNMTSRAKLMNGTLNVESTPSGSTITLYVPLNY